MGVQGLWQLLEQSGRPVTLESLEGKRLAVDISLWLHQSVRGSASHGNDVRNAHLVTLFQRVTKLLFYRVRPVFVFDGNNIPSFKKRTLNLRRMKRDVASLKLTKIQQRILAKAAKANLFNQKSALVLPTNSSKTDDDLYELPETTVSEKNENSDSEYSDDEFVDSSFGSCSSDIDLSGETFGQLPTEIQREMLIDLQEKQRDSRIAEELMPHDSTKFSNFQMSRLLKKSQVNQKLDQVNKELTTSYTHSALSSLCEDYRITDSVDVKQIVYEGKHCQHILIKDRPIRDNVDEPLEKSPKLSESESTVTPSTPEPVVDFKLSGFQSNSTVTPSSKLACNSKIPCEPLATVTAPTCEPPLDVTVTSCTVISSPSIDTVTHFHATDTVKIDMIPSLLPSKSLSESSTIMNEEKTQNTSDISETVIQKDTQMKLDSTDCNNSKFDDLQEDTSDDDFEDVNDIVPDFGNLIRSQESVIAFTPPMTTYHSAPASQTPPDDRDTASYSGSGSQIASSVSDADLDLEAKRRTYEGEQQSMTERMYEECQELLSLFGIPYMVACGEAEAQCAWLELNGFVNGTITEDSDIWLFGGKKVYRHIFNKDKHIHLYTNDDIEKSLGLSREKLIQIAMLSGCDYTDGIEGVGIVTALEILSQFHNSTTNSDPMEPLLQFKEFWSTSQTDTFPAGNSIRHRLSRLKCKFPECFPDSGIFNEYMSPAVDQSTEPFAWGKLDKNGLIQFAFEKMGWIEQKTTELLQPIIPRMEKETKSGIQTHISSFMYHLSKEQSDVGTSKRVQQAINKLKEKDQIDDEVLINVPSPETKKEVPTKIRGKVETKKRKPAPKTRKKLPPRKSKEIAKNKLCISESDSD